MNYKMVSMRANKFWKLVDVLQWCKIIGAKWVLKINFNALGMIKRYHLAAKGYTQRHGLNYVDIFSYVVRLSSI